MPGWSPSASRPLSGSAPIFCSRSPSSAISIRSWRSCWPAAFAGLCAVPTAFVVFRLRGAYFAIGTWVMAEVYRLVLAQFKQLGRRHRHLVAAGSDQSGRAWHRMRSRRCSTCARRPRATSITYWVALALVAGTILAVYWILRSRRGLALAAIRDSETAARERRRRQFPHQVLGLCVCGHRHRHGRRS